MFFTPPTTPIENRLDVIPVFPLLCLCTYCTQTNRIFTDFINLR
ncbi:hypothetical protein PCH70_32970 [Pseudomonas cichorii JBC1]|nr:hypothetical protein PCH70_32970 [Pseudomonas cichorii JBC1]